MPDRYSVSDHCADRIICKNCGVVHCIILLFLLGNLCLSDSKSQIFWCPKPKVVVKSHQNMLLTKQYGEPWKEPQALWHARARAHIYISGDWINMSYQSSKIKGIKKKKRINKNITWKNWQIRHWTETIWHIQA